MENSKDKKPFNFQDKKEYILFCACLLVIFFVFFKFSLFFYYTYQADKQFLQKTECNTYKTIYISELKNGNQEQVSIIIKEAKNEKCLNLTEQNKNNGKNKDHTNIKKNDSEKVYNSVDVHEVQENKN